MTIDRLQTQRFELKYRVDEATAVAVRRFVQAYLVPDDFGQNRAIPSYPVHSLYLDSAELALYRATVNGDTKRFKLRVRYYDDRPETPVYLEIKRRADRCIMKERALVTKTNAARLIAGEEPALRHLVRPDARGFAALRTFCGLMRRMGATPRAHVGYEREAWVSAGRNAVRVTMDRAIRCEPCLQSRFETAFGHGRPVFADRVILEVKFTDRFPAWVGSMVQAFGLQQQSAAKYVDGVAACGEPQVRLMPALPGTPPSFPPVSVAI
ncbi:VTC domain-containing protein [Horticoccus sp. 23ND18S-11]|uniref:VTC domain-containing protein n=1 Tax=Horticoccus sp. 23ND18S-11 TaxID=3391832 RepID=UPI0039C9A051